MGMKQKKRFFLKKRVQNNQLKKTEYFKIANSQIAGHEMTTTTFFQNGNTFISIPQGDPQDFLNRTSTSEVDRRIMPMTQNTPGNGTGTTGSSGGSSQNSHLFVPNWSEIFPPPPQEQPPPIPSQNSSPPQTMTTTAASSRNNLFNFRQQVNNK